MGTNSDEKVIAVPMGNVYEMLTLQEEREYSETYMLRKQMLEAHINEYGIPVKSGNMRIANEILNSMDSQTDSRAKIRTADKALSATEDLTALAREILLDSAPAVITTRRENSSLDLASSMIPTDIVHGEDVIEYQELSPEDIIKG